VLSAFEKAWIVAWAGAEPCGVYVAVVVDTLGETDPQLVAGGVQVSVQFTPLLLKSF
jgi:hypothetical protein